MASDKQQINTGNPTTITLAEYYEIKLLAERLNVSQEVVRQAIFMVGNSTEKIKSFLNCNNSRA